MPPGFDCQRTTRGCFWSSCGSGLAKTQHVTPPPACHDWVCCWSRLPELRNSLPVEMKNYRGIFQKLHLDMFPNVVPVENQLMQVPKCPTDASEKQCLEAIVWRTRPLLMSRSGSPMARACKMLEHMQFDRTITNAALVQATPMCWICAKLRSPTFQWRLGR